MQKLTTSTKKSVLYGIGILIVFCFIFWKFAEELIEEELHSFDTTIINFIQSFISVENTKVMKAFTFMGSAKAIIGFSILVIILMIWNKKWWESLFFAMAVLGSSIFNLLLKWIFHRARPDINPLISETGYSFPSGHSMSSFVFYGMLAYFIVLFLKNRMAKKITIIGLSFLILQVGVSRIYLGVHYPSDVIAGFSAGGVWLVFCLIFLKIILDIRSNKGYSEE